MRRNISAGCSRSAKFSDRLGNSNWFLCNYCNDCPNFGDLIWLGEWRQATAASTIRWHRFALCHDMLQIIPFLALLSWRETWINRFIRQFLEFPLVNHKYCGTTAHFGWSIYSREARSHSWVPRNATNNMQLLHIYYYYRRLAVWHLSHRTGSVSTTMRNDFVWFTHLVNYPTILRQVSALTRIKYVINL